MDLSDTIYLTQHIKNTVGVCYQIKIVKPGLVAPVYNPLLWSPGQEDGEFQPSLET